MSTMGEARRTQFRWTVNGLGKPIKQVAATPMPHAAGKLDTDKLSCGSENGTCLFP